jgi:hypothetical protein
MCGIPYDASLDVRRCLAQMGQKTSFFNVIPGHTLACLVSTSSSVSMANHLLPANLPCLQLIVIVLCRQSLASTILQHHCSSVNSGTAWFIGPSIFPRPLYHVFHQPINPSLRAFIVPSRHLSVVPCINSSSKSITLILTTNSVSFCQSSTISGHRRVPL